MGPRLVMAKSTLERTVFFPRPSPPKNIPLFSHDGVQLRDFCSTSDTIYHTRQMKVSQVKELGKTLIFFFFM